MSYLATQPIRKGDVVRLGFRTGFDGKLAVVEYVDNTTAIATVRIKYSRKDVHISKLELIDRDLIQMNLPV